jgi:hypothetical protein
VSRWSSACVDWRAIDRSACSSCDRASEDLSIANKQESKDHRSCYLGLSCWRLLEHVINNVITTSDISDIVGPADVRSMSRDVVLRTAPLQPLEYVGRGRVRWIGIAPHY